MAHIAKDDAREERIQNEIVVDAYGPEEQATAWYAVLDETLHFPFTAKCIAVRAISPLELGEAVEVVKMAPDAECELPNYCTNRKYLAPTIYLIVPSSPLWQRL